MSGRAKSIQTAAAAAASAGSSSNGRGPVSGSNSPRSMSPATTTQTTQQEVEQQSWHKLMWIPLMVVVPASLYSVGYITEMVSERQAHMAAHPQQFAEWTYPRLSDLRVTLVGLVVLLALRVALCSWVFKPLGEWILPTVAEKKGKWTEAARADRVQRFSVCLFKLCFFIGMTSYGYSTLKDETWLPPQLGGKGDVATAWNGWPYSVISDSVKRYYLLELSYHAHSLVFHVITVKRNDFIEMTLHHTCAVLLVIFSYFANWVRIGSLVLFLHDIADVMAYSVKAVVDTKYTALTLSAYAGLLVAWGYTRLYVFPFHVISHSMIPDSPQSFVWVTSYFMIWTLQMLHIYWYVLFLIMGYRFAVSGKTVDIQQKAGAADGSYVDYHKRRDSDAVAPAAQEADARRTNDGAEENGEDEPLKPQPLRTRSQKKSKRAE